MADDPLARAREALQKAQAVAGDNPGAVAPLLLDALGQLALGLERLTEAEQNLTVQQALLDDRLLRVERNRLFTGFSRVVSAGTGLMRQVRRNLPEGSAEPEEDPAAYAQWVAHEAAAAPSLEDARRESNGWMQRPTFSLILMGRAGAGVAECVKSLGQQAYENWELCVAVRPGEEAAFSALGARVRQVKADDGGEAEALNSAAKLATGEYLTFVPALGSLSPLALYYAAEALQEGPLDVVYSDEDRLDSGGRRVHPTFKPDWSPDLLASCPYVGNLLTIRRETFLKAGGFSSDAWDGYLHELLLRLAAEPVSVHHIPRVLYHGASMPPSAPARVRTPKPAGADDAMTAIVCSKSPELLEKCLCSLRTTAGQTVRQVIVVAHEDAGPNPALHAVIQRAGATGLSYRGPFNFAAMNNLGARAAEGRHLLFLNDDVWATEAGWADLLVEQVARPEVGIAGPVLRYPSELLQHAGIVVGIGDGVGHAGRNMGSSSLWPWLLSTRNVSAVTGACLAIRSELFGRLGGFDPLFPNNYNDVDLCFRASDAGLRVICVAVRGLIHAECRTRVGVVQFAERYRFYERWAKKLRSPDPYYSRSLAPAERITLNANDDEWYRPLFHEMRP